MKNKFLFSSLMMAAFAMMFAWTACNPDDNTDKPVVVEDAYYVVGTSTAYTDMIKDGTMDQGYYEGEGFKATPRDGMYQKYLFITKAGDGFVVKKVAGGVETTLGVDGALTQDTDKPWAYTGTIKEDGAALTVPEDGVYFLVLDEGTNKFYLFQTNEWSVIGDAVGGWSNDNDMSTVSLTADGASWKIEGLEMRAGSFKFRANHNWTYLLDSVSAFTNLGMDENGGVMPGGSNFPIEASEEGIYTVELKFNGSQFTFEKIFTDSVAPSELPDSVWLVGNINDWNNHGLYMAPKGNDVHVAYNYLDDNSEVKLLVARDSWDVTWGAGDAADKIAKGGGNIVIKNVPTYSGAGFYEMKFDLANGTLTLTKISTITVIGDAVGGWDADHEQALTYDATNNVWSGQVTVSAADYKFRANNDWAINWGGSLENLTLDGGNLTATAGTFTFTLYLSGEDKFYATVK